MRFLVDKSAEKIVKTVKSTGTVMKANSSSTNKRFTLSQIPHVNKRRESGWAPSYKRLLDIYSSSSKTIVTLMSWSYLVVLN